MSFHLDQTKASFTVLFQFILLVLYLIGVEFISDNRKSFK